MLEIGKLTHLFARPGQRAALDFVKTDDQGRTVSCINCLTLDEIRARENDPSIQLMSWDDYQEQCVKPHEDGYLAREPKEITDEDFSEMLCILPPMKWVRYSSEESFQISELTSGRITEAFVRVDNRHFRFYCIAGTSHGDLIRRISHLL
jgi:hypothetical protein